MVSHGEAAAATNDWQQVGRVVQTTLRLAPEELQVLRLAVRFCTENRLQAGLNYWQMVQAKADLNLDEQYHYARLAVDLGRTDLPAQLLQKLVSTNRIDPRVLRLVVTHAEAVANPREAIDAARRRVSETLGNPEAENALGKLLFGSPSPVEHREGRGLLWGLAPSKGASWLADNKLVHRVLDVLPEKIAEQNPILMTGRLQALLESGQLAEVKRFLELDTCKVEAFMLHCLRAYAAGKEEKPQLMAGHFENALAAAGNNPARLRFIAGYAEQIGQPSAAIAAYRRLMQWPAATVEAGQKIMNLAMVLKDTRVLRETTIQLAAYLPGDRGVAILNAYLSALLQDTSARAKDNLLGLLGENPSEPDAPLALALIELRLGEAASALSRLENMPRAWIQSTPQHGAIYAAALSANEQRELARRIARSVDVAKLRPEELELIREIRQ